MLRRFSSRRASLHQEFLKKRLTGATRYDRIAGYFQSSLLELANEELLRSHACAFSATLRSIRTICAPSVWRPVGGAKSLRTNCCASCGMAATFRNPGRRPRRTRKKAISGSTRSAVESGNNGRHFEVRVVPDAEFGFVHGKGGSD